jgi:hypothetical protein
LIENNQNAKYNEGIMTQITGKNGKPLYGAALEAVLRKQSRINWQDDGEVAILFQALDSRLSKLERRQKYAPLTIVAALAFGCIFGTVLKPDLAAIAVGSAAAGLVVSICRQ